MQRDPAAVGAGDQLSRTQHALLSLRALAQFRQHRGAAPQALVDGIRSTANVQAEATGPPLKRQKVFLYVVGVQQCPQASTDKG